MSDAEAGGVASLSRGRLIANAQERVHRARSAWIESENSLEGHNLSTALSAEFHNAVIEFFYALRPLKDKPGVKAYWEDVVLWKEEQLVQDEDGTMTIEEKPVTGFDTLEQYAVQKRQVRDETVGLLGRQVQVKEIPVRLPPDALLRISAKLDEAAGDLGFVPETDDQVIETILEERTGESNRNPDQQGGD